MKTTIIFVYVDNYRIDILITYILLQSFLKTIAKLCYFIITAEITLILAHTRNVGLLTVGNSLSSMLRVGIL